VRRRGELAAALIGLTALVVLSACADDGGSSRPLGILVAYRTADPQILLVPIDESTAEVGGDCWVTYRITATTQADGSTAVTKILDHRQGAGGADCTMVAVEMYQQVRLPDGYSDQRLIDTSTGKRLPVRRLPPGQPSAPPAPPYP
jgi:hypothetical protein